MCVRLLNTLTTMNVRFERGDNLCDICEEAQ